MRFVSLVKGGQGRESTEVLRSAALLVIALACAGLSLLMEAWRG